MKILVTGSQGQVGQALQALAPATPDTWIFTDRSQLDITDAAAVGAFMAHHTPQVVINAAAYTAVDKAETDAAQAEAINVDGVRHLARACTQHGAMLLHLSTDYVYHSPQNFPYAEDAPTQPQSVYAVTKRAGEAAAFAECRATVVVRTSWVYSATGHNFVKTMLRLAATRSVLTVVADQVGAPTYAADLAKACYDLVQQGDAVQGQCFNYANAGVASWYDLAVATFEYSGVDTVVRPIRTQDYPTPAARPPYSVLNLHKVTAQLGAPPPHWRDALKRCLAVLEAS